MLAKNNYSIFVGSADWLIYFVRLHGNFMQIGHIRTTQYLNLVDIGHITPKTEKLHFD